MHSGYPAWEHSPFEALRAVSPASAQEKDVLYWAREMDAVATRRDRTSFMRIYDHFQPRVQRYLENVGAPEMVAEELAQEALLRLWQRAGSYDNARSSLGTWLFRIARNLQIDRVRREPHWVNVQDALEQLDEFENPGEASATEAVAAHCDLAGRVEKLPAIQARLIRMSYFEGKTHREISDEIDMPLGTVKSNLRRALLRLQVQVRGRP
ncbi:MAG: ECF RNA polymerase sigma factor RpoE [Steroidobacteraceae bacterium]|nr:ECF RNA polymerase sigma factor RpoE [Steroidobacteraceae bacterium]